MKLILQPPLSARNGHTVNVLMVCRVSDLTKQDERSPEDQQALLQHWLDECTDLPCEVTVLAGSGSGERLERDEYLRLLEMIESDKFDVVLTEDVGRIVRRIHAHLVCEHCVDHDTRLISPFTDHVDTAEEGWQDRSIFSAWHHERSNRDTSQRIKRAHRARFAGGGCLSLPIFGYIKKEGAKTDDELKKDPEAELVYKEWFDRLDGSPGEEDDGALYSEIGDWLNEEGVPTGPYCRKDKWDGPMVSRVTHNWILKGVRSRNKRKSKRNNNTGKYKSEKADPEDLRVRRVPHLAFFDEVYYDRVVAKADARNAKFSRNGKGGADPRRKVPKKRTRFPGQNIHCGICGRLFVFGGHGQKDHLQCTGSREYKCWNAITVDGPLAAEKISQMAFAQFEALEHFDPIFLKMVNEEAGRLDAERDTRLRDLAIELKKVRKEIDNLLKFIRAGDTSERVRADLGHLEEEEKKFLRDQDRVMRMPSNAVVVPSVEEVKQMTREAFLDLAIDSFEFASRMRKLTIPIHVYPFRLCDGGHIVLRAKFRLHIANLFPDERLREALQHALERELKVDLFNPPQRVEYRERIMTLRNEMTERETATHVGITVTAAQRAAVLDRLMNQLGLEDPYVRLTDPPPGYAKLRGHRHPRYRFEPLPNHTPDW